MQLPSPRLGALVLRLKKTKPKINKETSIIYLIGFCWQLTKMLSTIVDFILKRPRLITELRGHSGPVITMAISSNRRLLASGGTDGVRIWDLKTFQEIAIPQQPLQERGQVSCVLWITHKSETLDTLCYGNALGYLVFLQHRPAEVRLLVKNFALEIDPICCSKGSIRSHPLGKNRARRRDIKSRSGYYYRKHNSHCNRHT
jgi:WD40 repeat protein